MVVNESSPSTAEQPDGFSAPSVTAWAIALGIASLIAWLAYNNPPIVWRIPDDMTHIGALSPPEDQAKLRAVEVANRWKNTLLTFSLAGLGIGLSGALLYGAQLGKNIKPAVLTLVVGIAAGAVSGVVSLLVRIYLDKDHPIPFVSDDMRPLFADSVVFAVASVLLLLPVSALLTMQGTASARNKAVVVPLAGLLTGLVVPMTAAMALSSHSNTSFFPPRGLDLTSMWFAVLGLVTLLLVSMADKKPRQSATPAT